MDRQADQHGQPPAHTGGQVQSKRERPKNPQATTGRFRLGKLSHRRGSAIVMAVVFTAIIGSTVAYVLMGSNRQTRNTFRARLMDTCLAASAVMVKTMSQQAYYMATTRPAQLGGNFDNLNALITSIEPPKMLHFKPVQSDSGDNLALLKPSGGSTGEWSQVTDPNDDWNGFTIRRWNYDVVAFVNATDDTDATKIDPVAERLGFGGAGFQSHITINYIPLYMYAIFYDNDLEFHPGPKMEVQGPVHTNSTLWLGAGNSLWLNSRVSSAGKIRSYRDFWGRVSDSLLQPVNYRKPDGSIWNPESSDHTGSVNITNKAGESKGLNRNLPGGVDTNLNGFLDSLDNNWLTDALNRFGGNLSDQAMGNKDIQPPLPFVGEGDNRRQADASDLIQRVKDTDSPDLANAKIENVADIRITGDPSQVDWRGNLTDITIEVAQHDANGFVTGWKKQTIPNQQTDKWGRPEGDPLVEQGSFVDNREDIQVKTFDLNMEEFLNRPEVANAIADGNGVIYVSTEANGGTMNAVRLTDAENVPSKSGDNTLTIATDRPMYLEGDVNTGNNPATLLLAADAMYVTSQHLTDSITRNGKVPNAKRATETNAIFMLGQVSSKYGKANANGELVAGGDTIDHFEDGYRRKDWSGGVHNVLRYLENWSGVKHTYNGSIICLFESQVATAPHRGDYYSAPNRDYNWDASLKNKVPPRGMPVLVEVQTTPLERVNRAEAVAIAE